MIARLTGKLVLKSLEHIIINVNGVGYELFVPLSTYHDLPQLNEDVTLETYLNVREDALTLYGFLTSDEKGVFLKLTSINGIGPKLALSVLSGITTADLIAAIEMQDITKLTTISGIGKKIAQRMALELKDKLKGFQPSSLETKTHGHSDSKTYSEVISALTNLGYKRVEAESALNMAFKMSDEKSIEKLLKMSLTILSKSNR